MRKISGKTYKKIMFAISLLAWLMLANEALLIHMKDQSQEEKLQKERQGQIPKDMQGYTQKNTQEYGQEGVQKDTEESIQGNTEERTAGDVSQSASRETKKQDPKIRVLLMDSGYDTYQHEKVSLEIKGKAEKGDALYLINELPLETYLEGVVPSEMPSSYHQEALKAQAVCARTYAWKQIEDGSLKEYGADVDDSVNFQVYQNQAPAESTTSAVVDTKGQVMTQNGELIQAYYFSTSAGTTSTDQIWGADSPAPYLKSVACRFDKDQPWGSWIAEIPWEQVEKSAATYSQGKLLGLQITRKNESSAVTGLTVNTELGSFLVEGEYDVRRFLTPAGCQITEQDGSAVTGGTLLPSAYFTMEQEAGNMIRIQGKGYGHGVGMSQSGADQMADRIRLGELGPSGHRYMEFLCTRDRRL